MAPALLLAIVRYGFAPAHARRPQVRHQPREGAAGDSKTIPVRLPPDLAHAINPAILGKDAHHLRFYALIRQGAI